MMLKTSPIPRVATGLALAAGVVMSVIAGCGTRGPLDDASPSVLDAGLVDAAPVRSAEPEPEPPDATPPLAPPPIDAGREAGIAECGMCVLTSCGQTIFDCATSAACRDVFQCVVTTCLGVGGSADGGAFPAPGGGLNPLCMLQCAGKDPKGADAALAVFLCITRTCGPDCGTILGGLGGFGGGFGDNAKADPVDPSAFTAVFSPWPELCSVATPALR